MRECFLVQAALLDGKTPDIGVRLLDVHADRLFSRFRRDWDTFAGAEALCLSWFRATFAGVLRVSRPRRIRQKDFSDTTAESLYAKYVRVNVLPFRTHLRQYSPEAAAGRFGRQIAVEPEPRIPDGSLCAFRSGIAGSAEGKVVLMEQYGESGGSRRAVKRYRVSRAADPNRQGDAAWLHERMV